jgi:hypothetical protein
VRGAVTVAVAVAVAGCATTDAAGDAPVVVVDAPVMIDAPAPPDAGGSCSVFGAPGECMSVADCGALGDHTPYAGHCPGPADVQCCIVTPSVADNPPIPTGYKLMMQSEVTPAMTAWAIDILHDTANYPMFATATMQFGTLTVLARVEWHPPDFQNGAVHRGVTLYEPI